MSLTPEVINICLGEILVVDEPHSMSEEEMIGEYAELGKNSNLYLEQISLTLPGVPVG
jgi:hypothetical protein